MLVLAASQPDVAEPKKIARLQILMYFVIYLPYDRWLCHRAFSTLPSGAVFREVRAN